MDRVIVNDGTKVNLYNLFEDLQIYTQNNFLNVIDLLIESYGVNADKLQDGTISSTDTSLKVTAGGTGNTYVNVGAGEALTSGLHYLGLGSPTTVSLVGLSVGTHNLYLAHQYTYSDPVDVMSGFAIGLLGGSQKNTRARDSYTFVWDTNPVLSGVALATVNITDGSYNHAVTVDLRPSNILRLKDKVLSADAVRKSEPGDQEISGTFLAPGITVKSGANTFVLTPGTGTNTLSGTESTLLKTRSHVQNTDTYTTSTTFYVGGPAGTGALVLTISDNPMMPLNLRVSDISPVTVSDYREAAYEPLLAQSVQAGLISHEAAVTLRWNWDECLVTSAPGSNQILVALLPGPTVNVSADELIGYHFWHPAGFDYIITDNGASYTLGQYQATLLTLQPFGHLIDADTLPLIAPGTSAKAWIHSGADSYDIVAIPVTRSYDEIPEERYESRIISSDTSKPVSMIIKENYFLGEKLYIKIRANNVSEHSSFASMPAGSFTKPSPWKSPVSYTSPFLVKIPDISSVGASVSAAGTTTGFTVNINGWDLASAFELVWSTDQNGADFSNTRADRLVTSSRTVDISTSQSLRYYIKVRPLISGQAVADALATEVMSGSGGQGPTIYSYGPISVNLKTFSGTLVAYDAGEKCWTVSGLVTPAASSSISDAILTLDGEVITVDSIDYAIADVVTIEHTTSYGFSLINSVGTRMGADAGFAGKTFTVGVSKSARELITWTGPAFDYVVTNLEVVQYARPGGNYYTVAPVLRAYPLAMESNADSVVLGTDGNVRYVQDTDILVSQAWGNRILRVDLWDPSGVTNANYIGLVADVTISYKSATAS